MFSPAEEGRNEEENEQDTAADGEEAGELGGEGTSAAGAAGLTDDGNQDGAGGNGKENEPQPQELVRKGMEGTEGV